MKRKQLLIYGIFSYFMIGLVYGCGRDTSLEPTDYKETEVIDTMAEIPETEIIEDTQQEIESEAQETIETNTVINSEQIEENMQYGVVAATGDFVTKGKVNVRTGPSTKYDILMVTKKGDHIPIIGVANTGWYQVKLKDENGTEFIAYMSNKWLDGEFEQQVIIQQTKYKPSKIIKKATKLAKEKGYTLIADDLEDQLTLNKISKETYDFLMPYGKSTYTCVSITTDLENAIDMDGNQFEDEDAIAAYLVDRLLTESDTCFTFVHERTYHFNNKEYYEFRCYKY